MMFCMQLIVPSHCLTDILSGEEYVTVSAVLPMLVLLETDLLKEDVKDTELTNDIKYRVLDVIKRRYSKLNDTAIEIF